MGRCVVSRLDFRGALGRPAGRPAAPAQRWTRPPPEWAALQRSARSGWAPLAERGRGGTGSAAMLRQSAATSGCASMRAIAPASAGAVERAGWQRQDPPAEPPSGFVGSPLRRRQCDRRVLHEYLLGGAGGPSRRRHHAPGAAPARWRERARHRPTRSLPDPSRHRGRRAGDYRQRAHARDLECRLRALPLVSERALDLDERELQALDLVAETVALGLEVPHRAPRKPSPPHDATSSRTRRTTSSSRATRTSAGAKCVAQ